MKTQTMGRSGWASTLGVACAALLSLSTSKADIIINPNDQHAQVGASNPRDIDVQYKQKHHRVDETDTDPISADDLNKVFEVWSADPMMADVDVTNGGPIDDRHPIDPPGVAEPRSLTLFIGALIGFSLARRYRSRHG